MAIQKQTAAVDTDFLLHLVTTDGLGDDRCEIIAELFEKMLVEPIMHGLVHDYELQKPAQRPTAPDAALALELFAAEVVAVKPLEDIVGEDPDARDYYKLVFSELYQDVKKKAPPIDDILTEWTYHESLGEVHSAVMCVFLDCGLFLSDDNDSRTLKTSVLTKFNFNVTVYDREAACAQAVALSGGGGRLNRNMRHRLSHKRTD